MIQLGLAVCMKNKKSNTRNEPLRQLHRVIFIEVEYSYLVISKMVSKIKVGQTDFSSIFSLIKVASGPCSYSLSQFL